MAACEQDLAWLYERLQDLWDRTGSVDDVFEEVSGYMNGFASAQSNNEILGEALDKLRVWALDNHTVPSDIVADVEYALVYSYGRTNHDKEGE